VVRDLQGSRLKLPTTVHDRSRRLLVLEVALMVALTALAWSWTYLAGGTKTVAPHLFYLPVLYAALRLPVAVAAATAVIGGILAGPLMPLDVAAGQPQETLSWILRLVALTGVALLTGLLAAHDRQAWQHGLRIAEAQRDLVARQAELTQILAHELRTPLTIVKGGVELLDQHDLAPSASPLLASMRRAVHRLEELTTVVDAASQDGSALRLDAGPHLLTDILDDAIASLAKVRDVTRIRRTIALDDELIVTTAGPLRVALTCLLDNALRFSPASTPVEVSAERSDGGFRITIRDHGPGIPAAELPRVFEPYHQVDHSIVRDHDGLGLGLYAARRVIRLLGGELTLLPAEGPGMVATLTLPVAQDASQGTDRPASAADLRAVRRRELDRDDA
jgi:signal transduction histidine kinase